MISLPGLFLLSSQFALGIKIFQEGLPLCRTALAIGLNPLVIDELRYAGIAVVEIIVLIIGGGMAVCRPATEYKVIEDLATGEAYKGGTTRKEVFAAQVEIYSAQKRDLRPERFHRIAEAQLAGGDVEPFDIIAGEQGPWLCAGLSCLCGAQAIGNK